jgi:hypothetical protein
MHHFVLSQSHQSNTFEAPYIIKYIETGFTHNALPYLLLDYFYKQIYYTMGKSACLY